MHPYLPLEASLDKFPSGVVDDEFHSSHSFHYVSPTSYNNASIWPFLCHHFLPPLIQNLPKPVMFYVSCVELELIPQNEFHFAVLLVV
ncbi:unnamed protein product [Brassica oleracea var. botrytis]